MLVEPFLSPEKRLSFLFSFLLEYPLSLSSFLFHGVCFFENLTSVH